MAVFPILEAMRAARGLAIVNVRRGESVLVLSSADQDETLLGALLAACEDAGASSVSALVLSVPASRATYAHPPAALAAARAADLTIVATSMAFPRAYDDMTKAILGAGRRLVLINNAPMPDFCRGAALADSQDLLDTTRRAAAAVSAARSIHVRSSGGTDLRVGVCRPCMVLTGYADEECRFGSYPSGEAMLSPEEGTAEGVFVADQYGQVVYITGSGPQLGLLVDPIRLHFSKGRLVKLEGGLAKAQLEAIIAAADDQVAFLGELGIGTNTHARPIAAVENKFRIGTAHIALGDNHLIGWGGASRYGGRIVSGRHIDLVTGDVEIDADGIPLIRNGAVMV